MKVNKKTIKIFYLNKDQAFQTKNAIRMREGFDPLSTDSLEFFWKHSHRMHNGEMYWIINELVHTKNTINWIEENIPDVITEEKEMEWVNI